MKIKTDLSGFFRNALPIFFCLLPLLWGSACSGGAVWENAQLEFVVAQPETGRTGFANLELSDYSVIRCGSLTESDSTLSLTASKSMNLHPVWLLFVPHLTDINSQIIVQLISAPVIGKEYEYDLTHSRTYDVLFESARIAVVNFGIPFPDWEFGAVSGSEKFPCCE